MRFSPLPIAGAQLVEMAPARDERGFFARLWCADEFAQAGIAMAVAQASGSFNAKAGTVRGMHFAWPPALEGKVVRCARGRLHDVLLDLRPDSSTYLQQLGLVLDADEHNAVYIPPGVAHGFQSLVDATEVHYMMSESYRPGLGDGVRHDDPAFGIRWPLPVSCISEKDARCADFDAEGHAARWRKAAAAHAA